MKKILLGLTLLISALSLAACNEEINNIDKSGNYPTNGNSVSTSVGGNNTSSSNTGESNYKDPVLDITTTDKASPATDVETTVEMVYDSVVSISAASSSSLSSGTGVLFASDEELGLSYIATCFHVIEGAYDFTITSSEGEEYEASLVGGYSDLDLAVLSIEATDLTYAQFYSDSDKLKLGSSVVCIGNPLGTLPGSVSSGVVSYVNREVEVDEYTTMTLIQTDVAINSGNSGGGLFNTSGALIGIVNAKYSSTGIEGLGFAIPINDVVDTIKKIMATAKYDVNNKVWDEGYVTGDYELGFTISLGTYNTGSFMRPNYSTVAYISSVESDASYSGAGAFELEDIIKSIAIDFKDSSKADTSLTTFSSVADIMNYIYDSNLAIGDTLNFTVLRSNVETKVSFNIVQFTYNI